MGNFTACFWEKLRGMGISIPEEDPDLNLLGYGRPDL